MSDYEQDFEESYKAKVSNEKKSKRDRPPQKDHINVKPGSLPWEEESMTYSRDEGSNLITLQRENLQLRNRLKDLSQRLNDIIEETQRKRGNKKKAKKVDTTYEERETANKKLANYE